MEINLSDMTTEARNEASLNLDSMSSFEIVQLMNKEDAKVPESIKTVLPLVADTVDKVVESFEKGGRLFYLGAGTSGRLGVVDASECPPTFGVPDGMVVGLIAGGPSAFIKAVEGAEDSMDLCVSDLKERNLDSKDIVIGIAASGRTPYVIGGLDYARSIGCFTVAISCNKNSEMGKHADLKIEVSPGPEVLTGSTRLKSGTTQKLILNMISTASMIRIGKCYKNYMVDVMQSNAKLHVRAQNIVMETTGVDRDVAKDILDKAGGSVKTAIVMILMACNREEAEKKLCDANGHIRKAIC